MRVIFMGTPAFAVPSFQALINSPHDVVAAYSQPPRPSGRGHKLTPSPIQKIAEKHDISIHNPISLKEKDEQERFASHKADIAVVAAYGLILPAAILNGCSKGCINIHPSDLPRWRGAAPLQRSIMAGDTQTAMCIMQMNEGLDTGDILLHEPYEIAEDTTAGMLHDFMAEKGAQAVLKVLEHYDSLTPMPQTGEPTYARKINKNDLPIDWSCPASEILSHIRGLAPSPAARTCIGTEEVKVFAAEPTCSASAPLSFECGDGRHLRITELQRPSKKRMRTEEALRGWDL